MIRQFYYEGRWYTWGGGFGGIFHSSERGVRPGDVRMIGERLFYAYSSPFDWPFKTRVSWTLADVSLARIAEVRQWAFGA